VAAIGFASYRPLGRWDVPGIGSSASRLGVTPARYRGLRPVALEMLIELAARVRELSAGATPLTVTSTVADTRYQQLIGSNDRRPRPGGRSRSRAITYRARRHTRSRRCLTGCRR